MSVLLSIDFISVLERQDPKEKEEKDSFVLEVLRYDPSCVLCDCDCDCIRFRACACACTFRPFFLVSGVSSIVYGLMLAKHHRKVSPS